MPTEEEICKPKYKVLETFSDEKDGTEEGIKPLSNKEMVAR